VRLPEKQFAVAVLANSGRADLNAVVKKAIEAYLQ
jgi:hypothetical protein